MVILKRLLKLYTLKQCYWSNMQLPKITIARNSLEAWEQERATNEYGLAHLADSAINNLKNWINDYGLDKLDNVCTEDGDGRSRN